MSAHCGRPAFLIKWDYCEFPFYSQGAKKRGELLHRGEEEEEGEGVKGDVEA